ncbi:hypothetical protein BTZ20_2487 [Rhodococcus sp. MTM3W5.2]|nr:hypothetical protein BTZ20_2487 [Rhodococcus sp. MTM3W5.2]
MLVSLHSFTRSSERMFDFYHGGPTKSRLDATHLEQMFETCWNPV